MELLTGSLMTLTFPRIQGPACWFAATWKVVKHDTFRHDVGGSNRAVPTT
jgi:hypothetical protein